MQLVYKSDVIIASPAKRRHRTHEGTFSRRKKKQWSRYGTVGSHPYAYDMPDALCRRLRNAAG